MATAAADLDRELVSGGENGSVADAHPPHLLAAPEVEPERRLDGRRLQDSG